MLAGAGIGIGLASVAACSPASADADGTSSGPDAAAFVASSVHSSASSASSASTLPFDDIAASYAREDIEALYGMGIVTGTDERTFSPGKAVTRAEFAALLVRLFGLEETEAELASYADVKKSSWAYGAVEAATQLGLVKGLSSTSFAPGDPVTREQAAAILARALKLSVSATKGAAASYKDAAYISDWAATSVVAAAAADLMQGDNGSFRPRDSLTRAETAVLLRRIVSRSDWASQFDAAPDMGLQVGWQYQQTTEEFIASVKNSTINTLVPRVFFLDSAVELSESVDPALVSWAKANGKKIWGMAGNRSDDETTHELLQSAANRKALADKLSGLVVKYGLDGLNLDFENVLPADRSGMTAFVTELASDLHAQGKTLSVDVSPDRGNDDDWTAAFDYAALGKQADYIVLMGYDEYWSSSPDAGSVSSLPWLEKGIDTLLKAVPASKSIIGLPLYTRKWTVRPSVTSADLTLKDQSALIRSLVSASRSWNETLGQYVYAYSKGKTTYKLWAEDGRSLALKTAAARERGVAGLAYWFIGAETDDVWASVRNAEKVAAFRFD